MTLIIKYVMHVMYDDVITLELYACAIHDSVHCCLIIRL